MKISGALLLLVCAVAAQPTKWTKIRPQPLNSASDNGRIIGGEFTNPGDIPYQAGVIIDGNALCGGSLINDFAVLTSARCVVGGASFEVHLGATNIYDLTEANHIQATSSDTIVHELYDAVNDVNDIAIIYLPILVSGPGIAPVRLPTRSFDGFDLTGLTVRASGWGKGDTGGPLVLFEGDGNPTLVGVTSSGSDQGCEAGDPAIFTRVSVHLDWISLNTGIVILP
ncbi:hypothetical protein B566_EDAN009962 [Ephemera danica]|nr:hypothetical protein B566_EDAN009962 [Ephemera danica]